MVVQGPCLLPPLQPRRASHHFQGLGILRILAEKDGEMIRCGR